MLCNDGLREGAKFSPGLASRLLCYLPLHKIWYGIDALGDDQARTPSFACQHSLAIGPLQDAPIAVPARASPGEGTVVRSLNGGGHGLLDQVFAQRPSGTGDHEATLPILHQASPPFPLVRLAGYALFFCTNDQNSSIST